VQTTAFEPVHMPDLQVYVLSHRLVPVQPVPSGCAVPVSVHCCIPEAHEVTPTWHWFPEGVQVTFAEQAVHWPARQTMLVPQLVPFAAAVP
jgi:hypothetical protein